MAGMDIGIDLGTANILICLDDKGIVLNEPSVVAIDDRTDEVIAVGEAAYRMIGKTPKQIRALRPLAKGVITDYEAAERMLQGFIDMVGEKKGLDKVIMPRIMVSIPTNITEVEKRAVETATKQTGARDVYLIEEPIAAAIGAGIDISRPNGCMIVDIGGGTCDVAVISLGGVVKSESIKVGGTKFDDNIIKYIRRNYNVFIGERTAEKIKKDIGCVSKRDEEKFIKVTGRDLMNGLPKSITICSFEVMEAVNECTNQIINLVMRVLEDTPPELSADIADSGIIITGGGSLIYGLDQKLASVTGLDVRLAEEPLTCVAKGTAIALGSIEMLEIGGSFK